MRFGRRTCFTAAASLGAGLASNAWAAEMPFSALDLLDLTLPGDRRLARRCLLLVPKHAPPTRLLVLCHGLGETISEDAGIQAWPKAYGLVRAYERLLAPPVTRDSPKLDYFKQESLALLNAELAQRPFAGLAIACPFTPNVYKAPSTAMALERYATWMSEVLLPELEKRLGLPHAASAIGLDGVSLGGFVALEVFMHRPETFGAVGGVQAAFGRGVAELYARRLGVALDKVGSRPLRIATSLADPFRVANERLAKRLTEQGRKVTFSLTPGPHSQPWLREVASVELLHYYDRVLAQPAPAATVR